jgi:hypothetical protein
MADTNPYVTVGSPNYAAPLINWGQMFNPNGQPNQNQKPPNAQPPQQPLAMQWAQQLRQMFAQPGAGGPMQIGAPSMDPGTFGGTAGILPPIV